MKNNRALLLLCAGTVAPLCAMDNLYFEEIVNKSDTLYLVSMAGQDFTFLMTPHATERPAILDNLIDLALDSPIVLSPLKGDGQPIYIKKGPESTSTQDCGRRTAMSLIVWTGPEVVDSQDQTFYTFCVTDDPASIGLIIGQDNTPELFMRENAKMIGVF